MSYKITRLVTAGVTCTLALNQGLSCKAIEIWNSTPFDLDYYGVGVQGTSVLLGGIGYLFLASDNNPGKLIITPVNNVGSSSTVGVINIVVYETPDAIPAKRIFPVTIPVQTVLPGPTPPACPFIACISATPTTLIFTAQFGGSNPATQNVVLTDCGSSDTWSVSSNQTWLSASPSSGSLAANGTRNITVSVTTGSLAVGTYMGVLTFTTSNGATATVSVTFNVTAAPITKDAVSNSQTSTSSTLTWSHTVGTNAKMILVVAVGVPAGETISGATYAGVAMTLYTSKSQSGDTVYFFYLLAPATGANNIVATAVGGNTILGLGISYYNVLQSTPFGTAATASSTTGNSSNTVTTTASSQKVVDVNLLDASSPSTSPSAGQTLETSNTVQIPFELADINATGSAMTLTWSNSGTTIFDWIEVSVPMNNG